MSRIKLAGPVLLVFLVSVLLTLTGCSPDATTSQAPERANANPMGIVGASKVLLAAEPEAAHDVIEVRETVSDGDDVVIVGRIGGSGNPWIEGRAVFSIVDGSLKACSDIPGDECPQPWDYCCETSMLPTATALVKVVDEKGDLLKVDAKQLLDVKELSTVVVKGKAQRDKAGNLTVLASGVFVKKK